MDIELNKKSVEFRPLKDGKLYKDIKDILYYLFSRYSYIIWVSLYVRTLGASIFSTLFMVLILSLFIAWRDKQFLDDDGFEQVYSIDKKIFDKLKVLYERCINIR